MKKLLAILLLLTLWGGVEAQSLQISSITTPELEVCGDATSFQIKLENTTGSPVNNPVIQIVLPPGIEYELGSLTESTAYNVQEQSVSATGPLSFSANALAGGDSIVFSIQQTAKSGAVNFQTGGGVFRNDVTCTYTGGSDTHTSNSYNILYPALTILSVSPSAQTILSGGNTTRSITFINGGNGKTDQVFLTDIRNNPALNLDAVNIGTISGDTIWLTGSDFSSFGNGDNFLDQNESVTLTETLSGISCTDITVTSTMRVGWGCEGTLFTGSTSYGNITIDFQSPRLSLATSETLEVCWGVGAGSGQQLSVTNTGSGIAAGIAVEIFKSTGTGYDQDIYSRIDAGSLKFKIGQNGTLTSVANLTTTATSVSGAYACLGNNPIGKVNFTLPDLAPGDTAFVVWDMYACCIDVCQDDAVKGWEANVDYTDVCAATQYSQSKVGQARNHQNMSFFTESPTDIDEGTTEDYNFIVSSFENTLPAGPGAVYKATFQLEAGLTYQSLRWHSNGTEWTPISVNYNPGTHLVEAVFPYTPPFVIPKSEIDLTLLGNCGNAGWKTIALDIAYSPDTNCTAGCDIPLECDIQTTTYLHCPLPGCTGLNVQDFTLIRNSIGQPDNNLDGLPDASGTLNANEIKLNRVMVGDTFTGLVSAVIEPTSDTWTFAGFTSSVNYGSVLSLVDATATIYDASGSTTYTISGIPGTIITNNNQRSFSFDLSAGALTSLNPALTGYVYAGGDSIQLAVQYKVESSVTGFIKETTFLNEMYLSDFSTPTAAQKESCSFRNGRITLIGYDWQNNPANNVTITSCTKNITQNFGMSIGDKGSNYGGGNLFPFEYRYWGLIKEAKVVLPPNYAHVSTTLKYYATKKTNSTLNQTLNGLTPTAIVGDTLIYDMEALYNGGQLRYSDDGWNGRFVIEVAPNCDVPHNTFQDVTWSFNYTKSTNIDGLESGYVTIGTPERIRNSPSSLQLLSNDPIQDAYTRKVTWDYKVRNTSSSGASNAWLHLVSPENIVIDSVAFDGGAVLTTQNDLYLIGSINANTTADLTIFATLTGCDTTEIVTYSGFECTGYPTDFASFACNYEQLNLYVEPKEAGYQQRISTAALQNPCTPQIELTVDITSVKLAHMFDMTIDMITPDTGKIKLVAGSSEFQYNISNAFTTISDPAYGAGFYSYNINDYNSSFAANGIPGVLDVNNNRYKLKVVVELGSQFVQGDFLQIQINGSNACGVALPMVELAFDPNAKFQKDNTAGLHLEIGNSWSASWGDYDNDGYDDLFVPVNDLNKPNLLYHNNGNGTFTLANIAPLTTDRGASISGTWGDYDNDGWLDLFVTNNVNSANKLYHNNGNGTFSSVTQNPIVDLGVYSHGAAWADYNLDGNLDLVVSDFHSTDFNFLFAGDGQGGFTPDQSSLVSLSATSAMGVAWGDYDNDGDPDLFIANLSGENNQLFENQNGVFAEITTGDIVNDGGTSIGGVWGDYDNDGDLDLFVTNSSAVEANFFYENDGNGIFTKITSGALVNNIGNSHGASWIDFDNDGDLDLIVANDQGQSNFFFANNGDKTFTKISNAITEDQSDSYGTAWSDFDNDGDYDLFIANRGSNANDFFINEKGSCTNHIVVKLLGCNSNSDGVGAKISVKATMGGQSLWQTREVSTQTSAMGGQNSTRMLFGLLDATQVDSVKVQWPSGIVTYLENPALNQLLTIQEACGAKVCGLVFHDINENGVQDSAEIGIPNRSLRVQPGNFQVLTNADGVYELYLQDGNYTLTLEPDSNWTQLTPVQNGSYPLSIVLANQSIYCGNDFGNRAVCPSPDLSVTLGTTAFRRGLPNDLQVSIVNSGAYPATGLITLTLEMTDNVYLVDSGWVNVAAANGLRTYTYTLTGVGALSDTVLQLMDSVALSANLGEMVNLQATVAYSQNECSGANNGFSMTENVVGSIDPNDKQVMVKGRGVQKMAGPEEVLLYRIRFQNLGTYAARIVTVLDTLSESLDWTTFQMETTSHPFDVSLVNGVLRFRNDHIELPDSLSDPEGSQGYITFSIAPKQGLVPYTLIENRASIQFDYNGYITTNTTEMIIGGQDQIQNSPFPLIYPNPAQESAEVLLIGEDQKPLEITSLQVVDLQGQTLLTVPVNATRKRIEVSKLTPGMYIVNIETPTGEHYHQRLSIIQ